jgi:hypothetical protein
MKKSFKMFFIVYICTVFIVDFKPPFFFDNANQTE